MASEAVASTSIVVAKSARGRPNDSPEVRVSKTLSYILRHGAEKEGLKMRNDGYIRVTELLARPKLQGVDFPLIQKLVAENDKQRYQLLLESSDGTPLDASLASSLSDATAVWWIRANQGHTLKVESLELSPVNSPEELPIAVHGTNLKAWESISTQGLSKMLRNHIHLATGGPSSGGKSGMRANSQVLIYIDVPKAMAAGLKFFISVNGAVLSEGDANGFIAPEFFERVEFTGAKDPPAGGGGVARGGRGGRGKGKGRGRGRGGGSGGTGGDSEAVVGAGQTDAPST